MCEIFGNLQSQFLSPRHRIGITNDNLVYSKWCDFCSTLSWSNTQKSRKKNLPTDIFSSFYQKLTFIQGQEKEQNFIRYLCTSKSI